MKKICLLISVLTLCMTLTACGPDKPGETGSGSGGSDKLIESVSVSGTSGDHSGAGKLTEGIYIEYDITEFENVAAPKRYYAEYQTIEQQAFFEFFSSAPSYDNETGFYFTDIERGWRLAGSIPRRNGSAQAYSMFYFTGSGDDYYTAVMQSFENYSTTEEFDFMTRSGLRADFSDKTKSIFSTDLEITAFAIDAESYLKEAENFNRAYPDKREWSGAADYYYIKAYQTVDGIPICENMSGDYEKGTMAEGCTISAVYTANGPETVQILSPWRVTGEAPTEKEFIDLRGAEEIIRAKYQASITNKQHTIESVRLVYLPVVAGEDTILTPVWKFCDDYGDKYPLYMIDAYTGEIIK